MTIRHIIYRIAHDSPQGVAGLAHELGMGYQVLANKLNPHCDTHHVSLKEAERIADFANGNLTLAEYFAQKASAAVVKLPPSAPLGDMGLLDAFMDASTSDGSFACEFKRAWEDGKLTEVEFARLEKLQLEAIGKRLALLAEMKARVT